MTLAIGIEIGGTKIQAGVGAGDETLMGLARGAVDPSAGAEGIRGALVELVDKALAKAGAKLGDVQGLGIGFGGPVDTRRGRVLRSFHVEGWSDFPLAKWASQQWGVPTWVENDASIAGLAEAHLGAGKGLERVFYFTIGSGIGGGFIVDGRIDPGQGLGSAEVGHSYVPHPGKQRGPVKLEHVCSGWSIGRRARQALQDGERSVLTELAGGIETVTAEHVYRAAEKGDALACRILEETTDALAVGISNVLALLDPQRFILGGGVSLMGPLFWEPLRQKVRRLEFPVYSGTYDIVPAMLGEQTVVLGAVLLGLRRDPPRRRPSRS